MAIPVKPFDAAAIDAYMADIRVRWPMFERLFTGRALLDDLQVFAKPNPSSNPLLHGIQVYESNVFPFTQSCGKCNGTGSGGEESFYCSKCRGGGRVTYSGMMTTPVGVFTPKDATRTVVIVEYHPRLFEPKFPVAVDTPRKIPHRYPNWCQDICDHCGRSGLQDVQYGPRSCIAVKTIDMPC